MNTNIEKVYLIIITQWFSCFGYLDKLPVYECFVIEWQGGIRKRATTTKKKKMLMNITAFEIRFTVKPVLQC